MNIALIAHDQKKDEAVRFSITCKHLLEKHRLFATGRRRAEAAGLSVRRFMSGSLGDDQQSGAKAAGNVLRDPFITQPHEPDPLVLLPWPVCTGSRRCPIWPPAEVLIRSIEQGDFARREVVKSGRRREE